MSLVHVFCSLYSAACQSYSRYNHINVFCSILSVIIMLFIIIMLSVITRSRHLSHNVTHTCILLLVFCFLCSASYVLLLVFCFLCFASYILLLVFCFLYSASYVLLLMFCFLYFASCILLHTHAVVILICVFCSESFVVTVLSVFTVSCRS
jgi:hypothetical protein